MVDGSPGISPRLSAAKQKLRTKLFQKIQKRDSTGTEFNREFNEAYERRQRDLHCLEKLRKRVDDLQLGVFSEIELVSSGGNAAFLSLSASAEKIYPEHAGTYHAVKLMISPSGSYKVRVNIVDCAEKGFVELEDSRSLRELVCKIASTSKHKICSGLANQVEFQDLQSKLGYQPTNVFSCSWPWKVVRHQNCLLWHVPKNSRLSEDKLELGLVDTCTNCRKLTRELNAILTRREKRPEGNKWQRQSASSTNAICFLSPGSKKERFKNIKKERKHFKKVANKYWERTKIALGQTESDELCCLMNEIDSNEQGKKELEKIFEEAESSREGRGLTLRELWKKEKLDFLKDQRTKGNLPLSKSQFLIILSCS